MLKVKVVTKDELMNLEGIPDDVKSDYQFGDEWENFLVVFDDKELLYIKSEQIEPEDVRFCRDLSWVPSKIEEAYKIGFRDGANKE